MKKIVAIAAIVFFGGVAVAQEATEVQVPEPVKDAFSCLYPGVKSVSWEFDEINYSASFNLDGKAVSMLFDEYGSLVEVKNEIKFYELPLDVNHLLKEKYSDWHIGSASRINSNGTAYFETVVEKEEETLVLVFNQHGGLLLKMFL
jgi:hypothetical protein